MQIREATQEDFNQIHGLVKVAFLTAQVSNGNEQNFVLELRQRETYIPKLELVMEENGEHEDSYGLLVAPLCIKKEYRNKQFGTQLMFEAIKRALKMGYMSIFLVGNPEYYHRFGFRQTTDFGVENRSEIPDQFVMGCELVEGVLQNIGGYVCLG